MLQRGGQIVDFSGFQSKGLEQMEEVVFSRRNLLIGKNGSGKTRFLKALEQEKRQHIVEKTVITLYFSEIQAFYNEIREKAESADESSEGIYLFDLLLGDDDSSFYDFLKAMENDRGNFLENMLSVLNMKKSKISKNTKKILEKLNSLLMEFLEKRLTVDAKKRAIYIEKVKAEDITRVLPLEEGLSEFSPGELMLFYLCVFLIVIEQKESDNIILIIDEPELHLHPRALVKMVQTLKEDEKIEELWIASHSLFLVPLFDFEEIVFIYQNKIYSRNSQIYKDLYESLVGLENVNIFEFLKSLDDWQYYQFIVECFCLPEPVGKIDIHDEQFCKLLSAVRESVKEGPVQMLDYGAGKCRIWECMQLLSEVDGEKNSMSYTAYEPHPEIDKKWPFKMYHNFRDILADKKSFHVVVLMNVLHEIEGKKWERTFRDIYDVLRDDGVLIFLEVLSLTKGEQPYGNEGYLVLQDDQVRILFGDSQIVNMRKQPGEKSNCWMITKKQVGHVSKKTIKDSIDSLCQYSSDELKIEFQKRIENAHQNGDKRQKQIAARKYAFLSQQFINAMFTASELDEFDGYNEKKAGIATEDYIKDGGVEKMRFKGLRLDK